MKHYSGHNLTDMDFLFLHDKYFVKVGHLGNSQTLMRLGVTPKTVSVCGQGHVILSLKFF